MINFDFSKDYILEDDVVKLIPLSNKHISELLNIAKEPNIWTYSFFKGHDLEHLTKYVNSTIDNRNNKGDYPFAVYDKRTNKLAGCTRFYEILGPIQSLRIGYTWYGKHFQGTGLNKHCKFLMFQFAFEKMNIERIGLGAYIENERSILAMKSVGCQIEGTFRGLLPAINGNGRTDAIMLSILKSDWRNGVKERLKKKINDIQQRTELKTK
jgi:RimJ/RimL family protein N-acetyltransferase